MGRSFRALLLVYVMPGDHSPTSSLRCDSLSTRTLAGGTMRVELCEDRDCSVYVMELSISGYVMAYSTIYVDRIP